MDKDIEQSRVQMTGHKFKLVLDVEILQNGLGQEVTTHVKSCELMVLKEGTSYAEQKYIVENQQAFAILALTRALKNAQQLAADRHEELKRQTAEAEATEAQVNRLIGT